MRFLFCWTLFFSLLFFNGCSSIGTLKKNASAKQTFQHAEKLAKQSYYKEALVYFRQLKSRFLYSHLVKEADLAIADIYFKQKEWQKARQAFEHFSELYPRHPQNDRALFYLALSYFHQLPTTEDRDLSLSAKTLLYLDKHLKVFPKSSYRPQVKEYKQKTLTLLAQQQWMIARWHIRKERVKSAKPYLKNLKQKYAQLNLSEKDLKKADLPSLKKINSYL